MARDRKRAKQRRDRRGPARGDGTTVSPSKPARADLPGSLDHSSGEADEFDAALVAGAGGMPAAPESENGRENGLQERAEEELQSAAAVAERGVPARQAAAGAPTRGGNRAGAFLRASWAELQRVQWPDRRQVTQATAVVLGFVAIAGAYLGLADYVAKEIVEYIL